MDAAGAEDELLRRMARLETELVAQREDMTALRLEVERLRGIASSTEYLLRPPKPKQVEIPPPPTAVVAPQIFEPLPPTIPPLQNDDFPAPAASAFAPSPQPAKRSLENRIGSQWFNRVGILALLIGVAWFLKLAIDNHWIHTTPTGRILTGLLVGAGVVLWSERFRRKGYGVFSYSLKAVGTGTLYLSLWASFHLYHVLPASVALVMMVGVTLWNGVMAWTQDAELLAVYALAGGFATPVLLGSGGNHEVFLFTYTLAMDVMVLLLVWKKPWQRLLLGALPGTVTFFIAWYSRFFTAEFAGITALFVVLLAAPFVAVALMGKQRDGVAEGVLTPLAAAAFLSLGTYSVLQDSGRHSWLPWVAVVLAALYLLLMRVRREGLAEAVHLTLAIVFLTIAIPLKAEGRWITVGWLAEGLTLLWVAARMLSQHVDGEAVEGEAVGGKAVQPRVRAVIRRLACAALALGVVDSLVLWDWRGTRAFWNAHFVTELFTVAVLALAAWMARQAAANEAGMPARAPGWATIARTSTVVAHLIAAAGSVYEIGRYWSYFNDGHDAMYRSVMSSDCSAAFLMMYGACLLAWVVLKNTSESRISRGLGSLYLALGMMWMLGTQIAEDSTAFTAFFNVRFLLEMVGAAALAATARLAWRVRSHAAGWVKTAAANLVAFNVLVLVAVVREIATYFSGGRGVDAGLAEAATVSGWLMVYAAALLAVGFWKRVAFVRWQGLLLIVLTIAKVFLYDMRNLSSVYRVLSFIGLGVLLMGVSFAYQKDWLNLREADPADASAEPDRNSAGSEAKP